MRAPALGVPRFRGGDIQGFLTRANQWMAKGFKSSHATLGGCDAKFPLTQQS